MKNTREIDEYSTKDRYNIDEALDKIGFGKFQWYLLLLSGIGFCATTVELILIALLREPLMEQMSYITDDKFGLLLSATFVGELVGGLSWGLISDLFGRKFVYKATAFMAAFFAIASAFMPCFYTLCICRFFLGLAIGGSLGIDFVYFVEFVPAGRRGMRTTFIIFIGILGFFYTAGVAMATLPNWRLFLGCCGALYGILFVGRLGWRWESPRYLLANGRLEEATKVLQDMAIFNGKFLPKGSLYYSPPESISNCQIADKNPHANPSSTRKEKQSIYLATFSVSLLFFCQTFGYYGLTIWMRKFANIQGILTFSGPMAFILIGLAEIPGVFATMFLIERARRLALVVNFIGSALMCELLLVAKGRVVFMAIFCTSYFFIVGSWACIYIVTPELFPTKSRSKCFGIAGATGKIAGIVSPLLFGYLWRIELPVWVMISAVSGSFLIGAIVVISLIDETSGAKLFD